MWEPTIESTQTGPLTYRFEIAEPAVHEKTEYTVQDVDPYDQPVLQTTAGLPTLIYTFPGPGQYRVTVVAWRPDPNAPDILEYGRAGRIIRITESDPPSPTEPDHAPEPPPAPPDAARPLISAEEGDQYLSLGVRVIEWLLGREPTVVAAFAVGLAIGIGATFLLGG